MKSAVKRSVNLYHLGTMPSLLDLCEKYFESRDLYEVLKIPNKANQKQGKHQFINLLPNLFLPSSELT